MSGQGTSQNCEGRDKVRLVFHTLSERSHRWKYCPCSGSTQERKVIRKPGKGVDSKLGDGWTVCSATLPPSHEVVSVLSVILTA